MHMEELSGLRGDVDLAVRSTLGEHRSDAHLTRVHLEGTGSAHGGYDCEKRTRRIQRSTGRDRHRGYCRTVSTVSLNQDEGMGTQDTG